MSQVEEPEAIGDAPASKAFKEKKLLGNFVSATNLIERKESNMIPKSIASRKKKAVDASKPSTARKKKELQEVAKQNAARKENYSVDLKVIYKKRDYRTAVKMSTTKMKTFSASNTLLALKDDSALNSLEKFTTVETPAINAKAKKKVFSNAVKKSTLKKKRHSDAPKTSKIDTLTKRKKSLDDSEAKDVQKGSTNAVKTGVEKRNKSPKVFKKSSTLQKKNQTVAFKRSVVKIEESPDQLETNQMEITESPNNFVANVEKKFEPSTARDIVKRESSITTKTSPKKKKKSPRRKTSYAFQKTAINKTNVPGAIQRIVVKKKKQQVALKTNNVEEKDYHSLEASEYEEFITSFSENFFVEVGEEETPGVSTSKMNVRKVELEEECYFSEDYEEKTTSGDSTKSIESESDKFTSSWKRPKLGETTDFFKELGRMPEIHEISLSASELTIEHGTMTEKVETETVEEEDETEEEEAEYEDITELKSYTSIDFSESDFIFQTSEEDVEIVAEKRLGDEDLFELFEKPNQISGIVFKEQDFEFNRFKDAQQIEDATQSFLTSLIDAVVDVAEFVDPREVLRQNLDKVRLFKELTKLLEEIQITWKINSFLHTKCVLYYRRSKSYHKITPDPLEDFAMREKKFKETVDSLDCLLARQHAQHVAITKHVNEAEQLKTEMEEKLKGEILSLETLMRKTFVTRKSAILKNTLESSIQEIVTLREELSAMRYALVYRQHTKGILLGEMEKLENITRTLRLSDYEHTLNQEYILSEKIEVKNGRLEKMHHRFSSITNKVAHMRDNQSVLFHGVKAQLQKLSLVEQEKKDLRLYNHKLKLSRLKLKKQLQDKSFECGLRCKPALLIDYDQSVELSIKMKTKINEMKSEIQKIERKIFLLTEKVEMKKRTFDTTNLLP